jgi:2',3'-cyclic-nucleotide 2'-phosphodiesterase (5'-nucleotidase family)
MSPRLLHYSDVENAYDDPERIGRLAGLVQSLDGDDALVCGTGDTTAPGVLSLLTEGEGTVPFFDAVGADVDTFGNHDFDYGVGRTRELVAMTPQTWLTTNAYTSEGDEPPHGDDRRLAAAEGSEPWALRTVDGVTIGLFGLTDPTTPSINPNAGGVGFADPVAAGREAVDALRSAGADVVVLLSHCGNDDESLAATLDVDVILGGHVHTELVERVDGTLLTRPGVNGEVLFEVDLAGEPTVTRHETSEAPLDEELAGAMRERERAAGLDEVVATVDDPIERSASAAFRGESRVGNFVADAYRWATDADVGLQNSGGIREGDPIADEVTLAELVSLIPFQESVAVAELTGEELLATFRQASGATVGFGESDWWHAHVSGARIVYDRATDELESVTVAGEPVDPDGTYTLATTEYLFHTDHEFPSIEPRHRVATDDVQYEVLASYARETGIDPAVEGRIVRNGAPE